MISTVTSLVHLGGNVSIRALHRLLAAALLPFGVSAFAGAPASNGRGLRATPLSSLVRHAVPPGLGGTAIPPELSKRRFAGETWDDFRREYGGTWRVFLDRRTSVPLLVDGSGIRWFAEDEQPTPEQLTAAALAFVTEHQDLFGQRVAEMQPDPHNTGALDRDHFLVSIAHVFPGPVLIADSEMSFYVNRGRLVAFGATNWTVTNVPVSATPLDKAAARARLEAYLRPAAVRWSPATEGELAVVVVPSPSGAAGGADDGGIAYRRVWRFGLRIAGERDVYVAEVSADDGAITRFESATLHARLKGGVFPARNAPGNAAHTPEQPGWPMPFIDVTLDATKVTTDAMGWFAEGTAAGEFTQLVGPHVNVRSMNCGSVSVSRAAGTDVDFLTEGTFGPYPSCRLPAPELTGDTGGVRSTAYHIGRAGERAKAYAPAGHGVAHDYPSLFEVDYGSSAGCYAGVDSLFDVAQITWDGVECNNGAENASLLLHEWGHAFDGGDGGGYELPVELVPDTVAMLGLRDSCIARGWSKSMGFTMPGGQFVPGCDGIAEQDWNRRDAHEPSRAGRYIAQYCPWQGRGACGREEDCEVQVPAEAVWDLATRDLRDAGLGADSAFQHVDRLFYGTRLGAGGGAYNCSIVLPEGIRTDGCSLNSWYTRFRVLDDDDGNLANGTPHAGAIFAAFDRHEIACGAADDATNRNWSVCASLEAPDVRVTRNAGGVTVNWSPIANAAGYVVYRADSCAVSRVPIGDVPAGTTSFTEPHVPIEYPAVYLVQARGERASCLSEMSDCVAANDGAGRGTLSVDREYYRCDDSIVVTMRDANAGPGPLQARVSSPAEPAGELITLQPTSPGASRYRGAIRTTTSVAHGDGRIAVTDGDAITVTATDVDDGSGASATLHATGTADCQPPHVVDVVFDGIEEKSARLVYRTDEPTGTEVDWGPIGYDTAHYHRDEAVTEHIVPLRDLTACTAYGFAFDLRDRAGNLTRDDGGRAPWELDTASWEVPFPYNCRSGRAHLLRWTNAFPRSGPLDVRLVDLDLNRDPHAVDTAEVDLFSSTDLPGERLVLTETAPNSAAFEGSLPSAPGAPVRDGVLELSCDDSIVLRYRDARDADGHPASSTSRAAVDCTPPGGLSLDLVEVLETGARFESLANEPVFVRLRWGTDPRHLDRETWEDCHEGNIYPHLNNELVLEPLRPGTTYWYTAEFIDVSGNVRTFGDPGRPFSFRTKDVPGLVWFDMFEAASGWMLDPQWIEHDYGCGTFGPTGRRVLRDVAYEGTAEGRAVSPLIRLDHPLRHGELRFLLDGWKNANALRVDVWRDGVWHTVWTNPTNAPLDVHVDISPYTRTAGDLQIAFVHTGLAPAGEVGQDTPVLGRVLVNDAAAPPMRRGSCSESPSFAGVLGARDAEPCAAGGLELTWDPAPSWGSGTHGTYSVYRGPSASFMPDFAHLVARGVTGTRWRDDSTRAGETYYYVVRAENDEYCATPRRGTAPRRGWPPGPVDDAVGSSNRGLVDGNLAHVRAVDSGRQPAPTDVGSALRVNRLADEGVLLEWSTAPAAPAWHVLRAGAPDGQFDLAAAPVAPRFEDEAVEGNPGARFYLVRALDACGDEGP